MPRLITFALTMFMTFALLSLPSCKKGGDSDDSVDCSDGSEESASNPDCAVATQSGGGGGGASGGMISRNSSTESEPVAVESSPGLLVPGSKDKERQHFQTRQIISLELNLDNVPDAEDFSVENETTGVALVQDQKISQGVLLTYNPFDPDTRNIFTYGENSLKTLVSQSNGLESSQTKIWVKDFDIFEMAYQSFKSKRQVTTALSGMRFEGWFNAMGHQKVTALDGAILVTGMQAMLSQ